MNKLIQAQIEHIRILREAGNVERCHTYPHHGEYTVGKHCYDAVSMLLVLHPNPTTKLIRTLLWHDCHERFLGDMPKSAKVHFRFLEYNYQICEKWIDQAYHFVDAIAHLSEEDKQWISALDALELWLWCLDQEALGNKHVGTMLLRIEKALHDRKDTLPVPVYEFLTNYQWKRHPDLGGE